jgi:hypothetical protein
MPISTTHLLPDSKGLGLESSLHSALLLWSIHVVPVVCEGYEFASVMSQARISYCFPRRIAIVHLEILLATVSAQASTELEILSASGECVSLCTLHRNCCVLCEGTRRHTHPVLHQSCQSKAARKLKNVKLA